jgi:hypothetical protein
LKIVPPITNAEDSDEWSDKSIPMEKKIGNPVSFRSKANNTLSNGVLIAPKHIAKHLRDFPQCNIEHSSTKKRICPI